MPPTRLLRTAQRALRRVALGRVRSGARPPIVVPDALRPAQPTRSTSPSYVNLGTPLPAPAPRRPEHDEAADARSPR